jgi:hypothetical protein
MQKIVLLFFFSVLLCWGSEDNWKTLRLDNHPKAAGLDFLIKYPDGWIVKDGKRPHILHNIVNENKTLVILVKTLPMEVSIEQAEEMFTLEDLKEMVPKGGVFQSGTKTKLEGQPAWIFMHSTSSERLGKVIVTCVLNCLVVYKKYLINLQGHYVLTQDELKAMPTNPALAEKFQAATKETMRIFNTLVINDRYK